MRVVAAPSYASCAVRPPRPQNAFEAVKNFRLRQIENVTNHTRLCGPLPVATTKEAWALPNPFLPVKNAKSGRWREANISLRRQADLVKKAKEAGVLDLLPAGPKKTAFETRLKRLEEFSSPSSQSSASSINAETRRAIYEAMAERPKTLYKYEPSSIADLEARVSAQKAEIEDLEKELSLLSLQQRQFETLSARQGLTDKAKEKWTSRVERRKEIEALLPEKRALHEPCLETLKKCVEAKTPEPVNVPVDFLSEEEVLQQESSGVSKGNKPEAVWDAPVTWVGEHKVKQVPGTELGTRLYAGRKRMFKLHLWERQQAKLFAKRAVLIRDMPKRVKAYKEVSIYHSPDLYC